MKVPIAWLREYVDLRVDARQLGEALTLVGLELAGIEGQGAAAVLDFEVTTNRVDCMNIYGMAREAAAIYGLPLKPPVIDFAEQGSPASAAIDVAIAATDLCPRFAARVLDIQPGQSPAWMQERLAAVGVRAISNIVDITNYVMLELGQPTHAFDLARIPEQKLVVRWARAGERLTTLDGVERTLTERCGVVASPSCALALAGVMGGANSEVHEATRTVVLEAAYWEPFAIRRSAKVLGLHTEASHRFERGADPENPIPALARIAHLLGRTKTGTVRPGLIDRYSNPRAKKSIVLRPARIDAVLGVAVPSDRSESILRALGCEIAAEGANWRVTAPTWRGDIGREVDLIEEVGRHFGLNRIPATLPAAEVLGGLAPALIKERRLRHLLASAGLSEIVSYAFIAEKDAALDASPRVALANPLSEEQGVLRSALVIPGMLSALKVNERHGRREVRLFEVGRVFSPITATPQEERRLGIVWTGVARDKHWSEGARAVDFFDLKGILELLQARLQMPLSLSSDPQASQSHLHPGRQGAILWSGERIGYLGALHPDAAQRWDLKDETWVLEMGLERFLCEQTATPRFVPLPRYPWVMRDISVVIDKDVTAAALAAGVSAAGGTLLRSVKTSDRYTGQGVADGRVSLTLSLRFEHSERTLTSEEVQASVANIIAALKQMGGEIRGE
jgi:phenylalanyl-tRNA synthetase beta chain